MPDSGLMGYALIVQLHGTWPHCCFSQLAKYILH